MIQCEVYKDNPDGEKLGTFSFNTLPRAGDILWLIISNKNDKLGSSAQSAYMVTYSAQWSANDRAYNRGYLIVKVEENAYKSL